jgi:septal ring factor EnvC (AmiA/AmiB activator)
MLAQMSSQLDAAEQDRALAAQIAKDRATLLALHQTVEATRGATNTLRQETAVQKRKLDQRLDELRKAQARLRKLEAQAKAALQAQRAQYAKMAADEKRMRKALAESAAAKKRLQHRIDRLVARAYNQGNIPSKSNGTLGWPLNGTVTQNFGCTGFSWEPPSGLAHFHNGIDIVACTGPRSVPRRRARRVRRLNSDGPTPRSS